jgi:hypothetical protein
MVFGNTDCRCRRASMASSSGSVAAITPTRSGANTGTATTQ